MRVLAIIPARGGSKGVPRKNIRLLAGKPLLAYTIDAAREAGCLDRIAVSTEDAEISDVAVSLGAESFDRPLALADDNATTRAVLWHHVQELESQGYRPDAVMTLQPTSPLRRADHIRGALALFAADPRADSLVSCVPVPHIYHPFSVMRRDEQGYLQPFLSDAPHPVRRQDKPPAFARNGAAIYITRTPKLAEYVFGGRLIPFMMPERDSIDLDTMEDFAAAELALSGGSR